MPFVVESSGALLRTLGLTRVVLAPAGVVVPLLSRLGDVFEKYLREGIDDTVSPHTGIDWQEGKLEQQAAERVLHPQGAFGETGEFVVSEPVDILEKMLYEAGLVLSAADIRRDAPPLFHIP